PFSIGDATFQNPVEINYSLNYLEIPLVIKLRSDQFFRMTYYGQFGLTGQLNLSATAVSSDGQINGESMSGEIGLFNLGMLVGGGAEYDVGGHTALNFGLQYSNGLVDISTINGLDEKSWFNAIRIVIGVMF
ncbi:MAG: outer membrane beta-barrel protein, partial [Prolixibacteraceae bacterium]|nr:outer membrane beta-barrel protein [Prolixibacteraceae bacterium]